MNLEILISAVILVAIGVAAWLGRKQGEANPVNTARLQRDVTDLRARLGTIEASMSAMRADLDDAPTKADIAALQGKVETVAAVAEKTDQAVVRIEQLLMSQALGGRGK